MLRSWPAEIPRNELKLPSVAELHQAASDEEDSPPGLKRLQGVTLDPSSTKVYVPAKFRHLFLFLVHGSRHSGHIGVGKAARILSRNLWWPALHRDVEDYIRGCLLCQCLRPSTARLQSCGSLSTIGLARVVSIDFIGPRTWYDVKYWIFVCLDEYSRFVMAGATREPSAQFALRFLDLRWRPVFGAPRVVLSDNSPFDTTFSLRLQQLLGSSHRTAFTYHPQGNGTNESSHRLLEHAMKTQESTYRTDFERLLQNAASVHNAVPHEGTGESPYRLCFGTDPHLPGWDLLTREFKEEERLLWLEAWRSLDFVLWSLRKQRENQDLNSRARPTVGDHVLYRLPPAGTRTSLTHASGVVGWSPCWSLPCRILEVKKSSAILKPLWKTTLYTKPLERPLTELKVIASKIPPELRR